MNDLNLPQPDYSRMSASAGQMWRTITSSAAIERIVEMNLTPEQDAQLAAQLGGATSKSAAALAAVQLTPEQDEFMARFMPDFANIARAVHPAALTREGTR